MKTIEKIPTIIEMTEEQKDKLIDLIDSHFSDEAKNFLQSNKNHVKSALGGTQKEIFEKEVLKKGRLEKPFLKYILLKLDDKKLQNLNQRIIASALGGDKELANSIVKNSEYDEERMMSFLAKCDKSSKKTFYDLLDCFGANVDLNDADIAEASNKLEISKLKEELKKREKEITDLKEEKKNLKSQLSSKSNENDKKIEEKNNEIKELEKKNKNLTETNEVLSKENKTLLKANVSLEDQLKTKKNDTKIAVPEKEETVILPEKKNDGNRLTIDVDSAIRDLESRTMLGVVRAEGIQPDKSWIIVTPIVPIISDNTNINRAEFEEEVDYRGDYSTFILYINQQVLRMCLSEYDAENYWYLTSDEKFNLLFEVFCKKIIFFKPVFKEVSIKQPLKLNAELIKKPVDYEDFNNSTFVPFYKGTKSEFENKVAKRENLELENYPASLSSVLKYVFVKDTIYEINYVPITVDSTERYIKWKYNPQEGKEPFKKLNIKVNNTSNDKYILTPNSSDNNEPCDLYVKNIVLMQQSDKAYTLFDEEEFVTKISENAKSNNLFYTDDDLKEFHVAIKSSNLVILAGPSGIGKTKLPLIYASALGLDVARNTVLFVPISPSYLEPEDVLGYIRPISEGAYVDEKIESQVPENTSADEKIESQVPENASVDEKIESQTLKNRYNAEYIESQTGLVSFLNDAAEHKDRVHLVIFDEMNLSQIEHWFAPFISLMEQDLDSRVINLYSKNLRVKNSKEYPSSISIGENVFFVGTVNIDETTKQISDRLLDRAIVINLADPSFTSYKDMGTAKTEIYSETSFSRFNTAIKKVNNAAKEFSEREFGLINDLNDLLTESIYNRGISYRSLYKMALYLKNADGVLSREKALDFIVSQIIVKKINGSREELEGVVSDDDTQGLLFVLNNYSDLSDFAKARKAIAQKIQEINKYGFTR